MEKENQIAVFIDAENINPEHLDCIFTEIKQRGNIAINRLFGTPKDVSKAQVEKSCLDLSIDPHVQYNKVKGKNSSDISLVINAMDVLNQKNIDTFILVSSDSDFTNLVSRIRENNKSVIGIGEQKTPLPFRNACNEFIFIENLLSDNSTNEKIQVDAQNVTKLEKIIEFIKRKLEANENQKMNLSQIQEALKKEYPDFSQKNYGESKFSDFIGKMNEFVIKTENDKTTKVAYINTDYPKKIE